MNESDWKVRLRMLTEFPTPTLEDIPLLEQALNENKLPLRRQAIVLFSMIESKEILPYLYKGLTISIQLFDVQLETVSVI